MFASQPPLAESPFPLRPPSLSPTRTNNHSRTERGTAQIHACQRKHRPARLAQPSPAPPRRRKCVPKTSHFHSDRPPARRPTNTQNTLDTHTPRATSRVTDHITDHTADHITHTTPTPHHITHHATHTTSHMPHHTSRIHRTHHKPTTHPPPQHNHSNYSYEEYPPLLRRLPPLILRIPPLLRRIPPY